MPRYLYHCGPCQTQFEVEKPMARSGEKEPCPVCSGQGERVFTAPGLSVKGSKVCFDGGEIGPDSGGCAGCDQGCCTMT